MATDFSAYLNHTISCSCGRTHLCDIEDIVIEDGALKKVPLLLQKGGYSHICLVEDTNTKIAAGDSLKQILEGAQIPFHAVTLQAEKLLPDEYGIGAVLTRVPAESDLIVAVGSGTINDLCRFVSYKKNIPYMIVGTAPSMDGFTSNVAAMITDHTKTTYEAQKPKAVIGDLSVLAAAPMDLIAAGVGDILGKYVGLTDWRISSLITGEYFCSEVEGLVRKSIQKVTDAASGIRIRDKDAIAGLMEGLVLSGIAMSYIGNSRPASGSEHHLAHYWEMMFLQHGEHGAWHGTKVGVGTVIALQLYRMLEEVLAPMSENFESNLSMLSSYTFDETFWTAQIRRAYGPAAPAVLSLEQQVKKNDAEAVSSRLHALKEQLPQVLGLIRALPDAEDVRSLLASLEAPFYPAQLGADKQMLIDSILYAKDLRNRYGLLQLLYDMQLAAPFAQKLADELYADA